VTKHDNDEARAIAEGGMILRTQVGSGVHGVTVDAQDDRDEMGICIEPPEFVIGLRGFEQYEHRTQPDGVRSGPDDLDLVVYSLRKWMRLALQGNPTVLIPLFVPSNEVVEVAGAGRELRRRPELVLSREAGKRFLGYMTAQRERLTDVNPSRRRTNRPELIERYGFDTKFAYHMLRLGIQGCELLSTGRITLPMPEPHRSWLRRLRIGGHALAEALEAADDLERELARLTESSDLPEKPNRAAADKWMISAYCEMWGW
jgi:hypothetical protein